MRTCKQRSRFARFISAIGVSTVAFFELCLTGKAKLAYRIANQGPTPCRGHGRQDGVYPSRRQGHGSSTVRMSTGIANGKKDHGKVRQVFSGRRAVSRS